MKIRVSIASQTLDLLDDAGRLMKRYAVSTARNGAGELAGSFRTTFSNDKWTALTPFEEGLAEDPRNDKVIPTYEATLGRPDPEGQAVVLRRRPLRGAAGHRDHLLHQLLLRQPGRGPALRGQAHLRSHPQAHG